MRKRILLLTAALVALTITTSTYAALTYQTADVGSRTPHSLGGRYIYALQQRPSPDLLPDFQSDDPSFYYWDSPLAGSGRLLIAIDREKGVATRNIVYIDTNGDGSLKDEQPVKAYQTTSSHPSFGPFDLNLGSASQPARYRFRLRLCDHDQLNLYVYSACWYEGSLTLAGKQLRCILLDSNANGTFNDKSTDPTMRDRIILGPANQPTFITVGNYVKYKDVTYAMQASPSGGQITLSRAGDIRYGRIHVPSGVTNVTAGGENGVYALTPQKGLARLPVGTYRLDRWTLQKRKGLDTWTINAARASEKGEFAVTADSVTELALGDPIIATVTATTPEKGQYAFRHTLEGKMGETITLLKNGKRPTSPKLTISDSSGTYKQSYDFKYG